MIRLRSDVMSRFRNWWPGIGRDLWLNRIVSSTLVPVPLRWRLLRASGANVSRCTISPGVWIGNTKLTIGEASFVNTKTMIASHAPVTIGERVYLAMGVTIVTSSHEVGPSRKRAGAVTTAPVTIGDGAWIGANATILPGVTIGAGTIVAAGAVVTADCEPDSVYAGVPAIRKRGLSTD